MEAVKDQSPCPAPPVGSKLRYPLRSAGRPKEGRSPVPGASTASSSKRGRPSCVSKSVDMLNLSAKEKSAKPLRRLSNPTKFTVSPCRAPLGSITPISETRMKRANTQGRSDTPLSEISSTSKRKFNILTSVSYWLSQIKLAESASKHSISLGFFKLALESGCEPLQRMREELKSYTRRHDLVSELAEPTQDLLQLYNVLNDFQQLEISQTGLPMEEGEHNLNEDAHKPMAGCGNLKPRSLNSQTLTVAESNKKERGQKWSPAAKNAAFTIKNMVHPVPVKDNGKIIQRRSQKPNRALSNSGSEKVKSSINKSTDEKVDSVDPLPVEEPPHEDKENMNVLPMEEGNIKEEIETS